jgi:hypothetical protein
MDDETRDANLCKAFPAGIPDVIFNNEFDHRQPYEGDHGIRFEAEEGFVSPFAPEAEQPQPRAAEADDEEEDEEEEDDLEDDLEDEDDLDADL